MYYCYLIELKENFSYDIPVRDIVLVVRSELEPDIGSFHFDLDVDKGSLTVNFKYVGLMNLTPDQVISLSLSLSLSLSTLLYLTGILNKFMRNLSPFVKFCLQVLLCRRFQITVLRVLIDRNLNKLKEVLDGYCLDDNHEIDYLLLPATGKHHRPLIIDWECVVSTEFSCGKACECHVQCGSKGYARRIQTKDGPVCTCMLPNSLVYTPHNGHVYCITGILGLNGNALLKLRDGRNITYKKYYEERYVITFSVPFCSSRISFLVVNGHQFTLFPVNSYPSLNS